MLTGPSFELYDRLIKAFPSMSLIASGGVHNSQDLRALGQKGLFGAIVGRAFYEGAITAKELSCLQNE